VQGLGEGFSGDHFSGRLRVGLEWCGVVDAVRMESWDSKINICAQPYNKALGFTDFHQIKVYSTLAILVS